LVLSAASFFELSFVATTSCSDMISSDGDMIVCKHVEMLQLSCLRTRLVTISRDGDYAAHGNTASLTQHQAVLSEMPRSSMIHDWKVAKITLGWRFSYSVISPTRV
jgi:hypothetical protein